MRAVRRVLFPVLCVLWLAACAAAPGPSEGPRTHPVHVRSNGWHTAIVVPRAAVAATGLLPEVADLPQAAFLAFGWGDQDYYQATEATAGLALRAALWPTPSVMHVAGRAAVPEARGEVEVLRLALTGTGFRAMVGAIAATFERPDDGRAKPIGPGLSAKSHFYAARGTFHLFNTCNTWTVRMLRAGGLDISPAGVVTAADAMARLRTARGQPAP